METDFEEDSNFVKFWNSVLEPKFSKFRHILQGGLSRYSSVILPSLPLKDGMHVLDVGCGWGDMAIDISKIVHPEGSVVGSGIMKVAKRTFPTSRISSRIPSQFGSTNTI